MPRLIFMKIKADKTEPTHKFLTTLTGLRGLKLTNALKAATEEKISKLGEYSDKIFEVSVSFSHRESENPDDVMKVRASMSLAGKTWTHYNATAKSSDMYVAVDEIVDLFTRKLRRRKRYIQLKRKVQPKA